MHWHWVYARNEMIHGGCAYIQTSRSNYPNGKKLILIGASLSEPHTNGTSAARVCYMCICIIIYRTSCHNSM